MSLKISPCCVKTIDHEGQVTGSFKTIGGLDTYQTGAEFGNEKVIVIVSDIFGHKYKNNHLVADSLSKVSKTQVLLPDILDNDPIASFEEFQARGQTWRENHSPEKNQRIVEGFLTKLREEYKPEFVAGIGHCFGAKYVVQQLTPTGFLDIGAIAHPSNCSVEEFEAVTKPLLISAASKDVAFPNEARQKAIDILTKNDVEYELTIFHGVDHGFAVRGDPNNKKHSYVQAKTIQDQVQFFSFYS
ncbi:protein Aim2p [[Candida] railenensis]|uniref:Protein Aim2p n=1 Tax=[Candida] railenensis TaxID=45579 RepID=A0A9P0W0L4_9ASCO|nr:protein Aim2p [[Candida] railenensis]